MMQDPRMSPIAMMMGGGAAPPPSPMPAMGGEMMADPSMSGMGDMSPIAMAMKNHHAPMHGGKMDAATIDRLNHAIAWDRISNPRKYGLPDGGSLGPAQAPNSMSNDVNGAVNGHQPNGWLANLYAKITGQQ